MIDIEKVIFENSPQLHQKIKKSFIPNGLIYNSLRFLIKEKSFNKIITNYPFPIPPNNENDSSKAIVNIQNILKNHFNLTWQLVNTSQINITDRHIFVANHSSGGIDGLIFIVAVAQLFLDKKAKLKELKILVNRALSVFPTLRPFILPVGVFNRTTNSELTLLKEYLSQDNPLLSFPAGVVSRKQHGQLTEKTWNKNFILQAVEHQRNVVPTFIDIQNSNLFYLTAKVREKLKIKLNLEMFLLGQEVFKQKNRTIKIYFSPPITHQTLREKLKTHTASEIAKKIQTYVLSNFKKPLFD